MRLSYESNISKPKHINKSYDYKSELIPMKKKIILSLNKLFFCRHNWKIGLKMTFKQLQLQLEVNLEKES